MAGSVSGLADGRWVDAVIYAVLEDEFRRANRRLMGWDRLQPVAVAYNDALTSI
jgi:hypothetical protein